MSALTAPTRQAVWDLAEQLADRPETITVSVDLDRWGRRKISVDIDAPNGLDDCRALLSSIHAGDIQNVYDVGAAWLRGVFAWGPGVNIPVHVFAAGETP